jgi:hypothetical protein
MYTNAIYFNCCPFFLEIVVVLGDAAAKAMSR